MEGYKYNFLRDVVQFQKRRDTNFLKIPYDDLEKVVVKNRRGDLTIYKFPYLKGVVGPVVLELIEAGYLSLFAASFSTGSKEHPNSFMQNFYFQREDEAEATQIHNIEVFGTKFRKAAIEYFNDCPSLVEKIKTREYKLNKISEVVQYYNFHCAPDIKK